MEQHNNEILEEKVAVEEVVDSTPPMGLEVILREFKRDRVAMFSVVILVIILLIAFISPAFIDIDEVTRVDLFSRYTPPGEKGYILGADEGGRDILGLLLLGTRNSVFIGFMITIITSLIGIALGIFSGYHGGVIDDFIMRVVDFIMILPTDVLIIVIVTIAKTFNVWTLIIILSAFGWAGKTRFFRTLTLSEGSKDYVSASKTMGTPDWKIMYGGILPNLASQMITNLTLSFAGNIGIETTLSFLGFGLPIGTPSLGTLIGYARNPDVIQNKTWIWLPAVLVILVLMLCINYIGQAFQRAADARQRRG